MLKEFIEEYNYNLLDKLTYNSYRTGKRNYIRDYDSISITELLSLIEDPNMIMVKNFYSDKLKEAQEFGTTTHAQLEDYYKSGKINKDNKLHINFITALIQNGIEITDTEKTYKRQFKDLPIITGDIDCLGLIDNEIVIIDYKTSKTNRNFKSLKYNLQLAGYRWLTGIKKSGILYLNNKKAEFSISKENEYYDKLFLELLEYAFYLYKNHKFNNLHLS